MDNNSENEYLKNRIIELEEEVKSHDSEKASNQDESIFRKILEHSTNAFYSHTTDQKLTYFSSQIFDILGYSASEVMIKWTDLISDSPMNDEGFRKTILAIEKGEVQDPYELELIHKLGRKVYVEVHEAPVVENGKTVAIVGALTDITERKIAGKKLIESEEKFRLLFEKSREPILIIDDYNFVECNNATLEMLDYSTSDELFNIHPSKLSPNYQPDGKLSFEKAQEMMDIAYSKGYHRFEWIHMNKYGIEIYMDVALTKIPYKGKNMLFTVWRNISKQKEYEKRIIESEKQYSTLFEQAADGILVGISGGEIVNANESILKLTGYKKKELIGKNISIFFTEEELDKKPLRYDLVNKGDMVIYERIITRKDGKLIPVEMNTKILHDGRIQALVRDLTKRNEAKLAIKKSEKKYRLLFENSQDGIFITDNKGIVDCNTQAIRIFGCNNKEELITRSSADFSPEIQPDGTRSAEKVKEYLISAHNGEKKIFEWLHSRLDGSTFYAEISLIPFVIDNKQYLQSIVRDITERKEIEQRIFDTIIETEEKERQRLASDIHDELGPLLASLKMYIESLNVTNDEKKQGYLKNKLQSLIKESVKNVREVSRALSPYLLNKYGLKSAIKSFIKNFGKRIKIEFETNLEDERFPINIETVYYRIIKELFNNTIKHAEAKNIIIRLNYIEKDLILIYEDDGKGINKDDLNTLEKKGIGLFNITNRIMSINGKYQFILENKKGFGFKLIKEIEKIKNK
ncbi:MAG: PAS domain S-box protein [Bacteroidales bacterium]|nr:PAS domain S-box protein [Bacteroidales bacterium]